jgi:hypothetical protein
MSDKPTQVIYSTQDRTVRECVQALLGLKDIEILSSAARATVVALAVEGNIVQLEHAGFGQLELLLDVTNADTDAGDTLDVFVDSSIDGVTWVNICHFTQVVGTDAATKLVAIIPRTGTGAVANVTSNLAAGNVRNFIGSWLRSRATRVEAAGLGAMSFTYSLKACLKP